VGRFLKCGVCRTHFASAATQNQDLPRARLASCRARRRHKCKGDRRRRWIPCIRALRGRFARSANFSKRSDAEGIPRQRDSRYKFKEGPAPKPWEDSLNAAYAARILLAQRRKIKSCFLRLASCFARRRHKCKEGPAPPIH